VGNFITEYSGVPQFTVGEEAVLFVWTSRSGRHQVIGYTQGRFRVRRDAQTGAVTLRQSALDEPMLEPPAHAHDGEVSPLVFSLTSFRSQVAVELHRAATLKRAGGSRQ
jgi:homogentisate 1,2-dioxygenase